MMIPLVAIFVVLVFLMPDAFFARMQTTAKTGGAGRLVIWQGGLVAFEHYPLVGVGLNNFAFAYRECRKRSDLPTLESGAHNSYLEIAVETGLVGFVLLLTTIVGQLRAASQRRKSVADNVGSDIVAYEAACYAILAAAFFIGIPGKSGSGGRGYCWPLLSEQRRRRSAAGAGRRFRNQPRGVGTIGQYEALAERACHEAGSSARFRWVCF